ncbi:MAG: hypothetical protein L0G70_01980 [Rubrobacter sp.]|nr:hypothetical protein [Rubrobacter sp.]
MKERLWLVVLICLMTWMIIDFDAMLNVTLTLWERFARLVQAFSDWATTNV